MCFDMMATIDSGAVNALLAYIDPGTGSFLFQMLIAALTATVFFFNSIRRRVMSIFSKSKPSDEAPKAEPKSGSKDPRP